MKQNKNNIAKKASIIAKQGKEGRMRIEIDS